MELAKLAEETPETRLCNRFEHRGTGILPVVHRLEACATGLGGTFLPRPSIAVPTRLALASPCVGPERAARQAPRSSYHRADQQASDRI